MFKEIGNKSTFGKSTKQTGVKLTFALGDEPSPVGKSSQEITTWTDSAEILSLHRGIMIAVWQETVYTRAVIYLDNAGKATGLSFFIS